MSVRQPWAWLLVSGVKPVENRSWYTRHRGPLLIHAARTIDTQALAALRAECPELPEAATITGAIVGRVTLVDCTRTVRSDWHEPGMYGWYVTDAVEFAQPVLWRGRLMLFDVPEEAIAVACIAADVETCAKRAMEAMLL